MANVMAQKFWNIRKPRSSLKNTLIKGLGLHPLIAELLVQREITTCEDADLFLKGDIKGLHDPFLLQGMKKAVTRVQKAFQRAETILIYGDYDVDGITSSAILYQALSQSGSRVLNYIPHRLEDGYGLNKQVAEFAKENDVSLIIAVDCGVTAIEEVRLLNQAGVEVIILDHHEPAGEHLPEAFALIDPKIPGCPYPFKHLAAVGLAAKFVQALGQNLDGYLDLIALGTIADVVPLRGENRIFVKAGLPKLRETQNKGLAALMDLAGIRGKKFQPYYAGFILGPRLNASGRLDSAYTSLDLLLTQDTQKAQALAKSLEEMNAYRQKLQRTVIQEAIDLIEQEVNFKDDKVIVVSKEGWHKGVLGIVASHIVETYYRPTIVITLDRGVGTASARSIEGFHLYEALAHCSEILSGFGGHKSAAGLTIGADKIELFRRKINEFAKDLIQIRDLIPTINIDGEIPLDSLNLDIIEKINALEPFGEGNPTPVFCTRHLTMKRPPLVLGKNTLKCWLTDGRVTVSGVGFGMGDFKEHLSVGQKLDVAYEVSVDDWNKSPQVQLKLRDIQPSEA